MGITIGSSIGIMLKGRGNPLFADHVASVGKKGVECRFIVFVIQFSVGV
jgi:hypothetical protein